MSLVGEGQVYHPAGLSSLEIVQCTLGEAPRFLVEEASVPGVPCSFPLLAGLSISCTWSFLQLRPCAHSPVSHPLLVRAFCGFQFPSQPNMHWVTWQEWLWPPACWSACLCYLGAMSVSAVLYPRNLSLTLLTLVWNPCSTRAPSALHLVCTMFQPPVSLLEVPQEP